MFAVFLLKVLFKNTIFWVILNNKNQDFAKQLVFFDLHTNHAASWSCSAHSPAARSLDLNKIENHTTCCFCASVVYFLEFSVTKAMYSGNRTTGTNRNGWGVM